MTGSNNEDGHTTFDELCETIDSFLEQHERDHPPHHRETLHFADFEEVGLPLCQERLVLGLSTGLRVRSSIGDRSGDRTTRVRVG